MHEVQQPAIEPARYVAPTTIEEVLDLLETHGDRARIIAGGTDLMVELDRRVGGEVDVLIDLTRVDGLDAIYQSRHGLHLGPLVTHNAVATSPLMVELALPLAQSCLEVGSPALRNRATVVGNVVTASPANDTISALRALGCEVSLASKRGIRSISLDDFHTGVRTTVMAPDELVTGLTIRPLEPGERGLYLKLGLRKAQSISVVHIAIVVGFETSNEEGAQTGTQTVSSARIALGSVAPTIVRATEAEAALVGSPLDARSIAAAATAAAAAVQPIDDLRATAEYRTDLIPIMIKRMLGAIARNEQGQTWPTMIPVIGGPAVAPVTPAATVELADGDLISATINGSGVEAPWTPSSLLDWLRESAMLTGTKEGCAEGECGSCTVHLEGTSVLSCLVPAGRAQGATIVTIEGLASDAALHPLQQAFIDHAAVQCGYCIPGFLMAGSALANECGDLTANDIELGLSGNLCRCTGYYKIIEAQVSLNGSKAVSS